MTRIGVIFAAPFDLVGWCGQKGIQHHCSMRVSTTIGAIWSVEGMMYAKIPSGRMIFQRRLMCWPDQKGCWQKAGSLKVLGHRFLNVV